MSREEVHLTRFFVTGGAGFIGGHLVARLLQRPDAQVVVYDNFSSGRAWHLEAVETDARLQTLTGDLKDIGRLREAMAGMDVVFHLASNPDIARAVREPDVDFWEGTPISTYGASKLAGEALICAYCHMFDMHALAFRFANVVGPRQTHGVAYDFVLRLRRDPTHLQILGDGSQSKSYIHVDDVLDGILFLYDQSWQGFDVFNVATEDYVTVREIADLVVRQLGLSRVSYSFTGGDRGWKGDVPVVRFDTRKLRSRGWSNRRTSQEALRASIDALITDAKAGRLGK